MFKLMLASLLVITAVTSVSAECVSVQVSGYTKANGTYVQGYTRSCPNSYFPSATPKPYVPEPYVPNSFVPAPVPKPSPVDWRKFRELADKSAKESEERLLNSIPKPFDYEGYVKNNSSIQFMPAVGYGNR